MDEKIKTNDQCLARLRDNVETLKKLEGSKKWYEKGIDIGDSLGFFLLINFIVFTISGLNPIACLITSIILIWGMIWGMSKNDSKELSEAIKIYEQKVSAIAKEKKEFEEKQLKEKQMFHSKEAQMERYRQLRKDIETMPQYEIWRRTILEKFGRKCAVCGETENLEVDHRYKSLYSIIQEFGITDTIQAYGCAELWDINNGAPLCKFHHDQTPSSRKYREEFNK